MEGRTQGKKRELGHSSLTNFITREACQLVAEAMRPAAPIEGEPQTKATEGPITAATEAPGAQTPAVDPMAVADAISLSPPMENRDVESVTAVNMLPSSSESDSLRFSVTFKDNTVQVVSLPRSAFSLPTDVGLGLMGANPLLYGTAPATDDARQWRALSEARAAAPSSAAAALAASSGARARLLKQPPPLSFAPTDLLYPPMTEGRARSATPPHPRFPLAAAPTGAAWDAAGWRMGWAGAGAHALQPPGSAPPAWIGAHASEAWLATAGDIVTPEPQGVPPLPAWARQAAAVATAAAIDAGHIPLGLNHAVPEHPRVPMFSLLPEGFPLAPMATIPFAPAAGAVSADSGSAAAVAVGAGAAAAGAAAPMSAETAPANTAADSPASLAGLSAGGSEGAEGDAENPELVLQRILKERGLPTESIPALESQYATVPTPKQIKDYDLPFVTAIRNGNMAALARLQEEGRSMNACNKYGESVLHICARRGACAMMQTMIRGGATLAVSDDYGRTPLHDACWTTRPHFDVVCLLLECDRELLRVTDRRGVPPLGYVKRELWGAWSRFLEEVQDRFWGVVGATDADGDSAMANSDASGGGGSGAFGSSGDASGASGESSPSGKDGEGGGGGGGGGGAGSGASGDGVSGSSSPVCGGFHSVSLNGASLSSTALPSSTSFDCAFVDEGSAGRCSGMRRSSARRGVFAFSSGAEDHSPSSNQVASGMGVIVRPKLWRRLTVRARVGWGRDWRGVLTGRRRSSTNLRVKDGRTPACNSGCGSGNSALASSLGKRGAEGNLLLSG